MSFPADVKQRALVACSRYCCICHKFVGLKIELHHIRQTSEGGEDTFDNCIPLCLDCHADMRSYDHKHPKGTKYTLSELISHRDNWYQKIASAHEPSTLVAQAVSAADIPSTSSLPAGQVDIQLAPALWRAFLKTWDEPTHDPNVMATSEPWPGYWEQFYSFVDIDIRQAAFDGKLPIWGRKVGNWVFGQTRIPVRERIPNDFWRSNWIDPLTFIYTDQQRIETAPDARNPSTEKWSDLWTSRAALDHNWPTQQARGPLLLEIGEGGGFFQTGRAGNSLQTHTRTLKIRIANTDPNRSLNECKLQIMDIEPQEYEGPWILKEGFSLAAGDHEFIPLATYKEPDDIKKSPYGGSFFEILTKANRPLPPSNRSHVLTLRATALGSPFCELKCTLWIDDTGRLRIALS